jgi:hypothetical protein
MPSVICLFLWLAAGVLGVPLGNEWNFLDSFCSGRICGVELSNDECGIACTAVDGIWNVVRSVKRIEQEQKGIAEGKGLSQEIFWGANEIDCLRQ